jgi:hypothetical protein
MIALWESTIANGLRQGVTIETQRKQIVEDLNEMERFLLKTFKGKSYTGEDLKRILGATECAQFMNKWGMNVICGLKLKIFKDDDMNGSLIVEAGK